MWSMPPKYPLSQPYTFSQELVDETIRCFLEENGLVLSQNEAIEALNNLAGLFLAFVPVDRRTNPARIRARGVVANHGLTAKT